MWSISIEWKFVAAWVEPEAEIIFRSNWREVGVYMYTKLRIMQFRVYIHRSLMSKSIIFVFTCLNLDTMFTVHCSLHCQLGSMAATLLFDNFEQHHVWIHKQKMRIFTCFGHGNASDRKCWCETTRYLLSSLRKACASVEWTELNWIIYVILTPQNRTNTQLLPSFKSHPQKYRRQQNVSCAWDRFI